MNGIYFVWPGSGFGNALIVAHVVEIVRDNGIHAVFLGHKKVDGLVDVPYYDHAKHSTFKRHNITPPHDFYRKYIDESALMTYMRDVSRIVGRKMEINPKLNYIPVTYREMDEIPHVDVVLCTMTGTWSIYRNWPYFEKLKKMFDNAGISYIDLNEHGIMSNECLNYVKKCKLYIGLETGTSHYVSKFANGKALILQSGFCTLYFWAGHYDYDYAIAEGCEYRPCLLSRQDISKGLVCPKDHMCMKDLTAKTVFKRTIKKL